MQAKNNLSFSRKMSLRWVLVVLAILHFSSASPWTWTCNKDKEVIGTHHVEGRCIKELYEKSSMRNGQTSLMACKLTCGKHGMLWPLPTGLVAMSESLAEVLPGDFVISVSSGTDFKVQGLVLQLRDIFKGYLYKMHPDYDNSDESPFARDVTDHYPIEVVLDIASDETRVTMETDESYELTVTNGKKVEIKAPTYFGARHGLETLSQMIAYDDMKAVLIMVKEAKITDKPEYIHRGLMIDTSRNFFGPEIIKGVIDGLSYNKMNILHWHMTDTNTFPIQLKSAPELAEFGTYSKDKVFTPSDIRELVEYARVRGVKIIPELDAPAHAGNGWQFAEVRHPEWGRLAVCVNQEEWQDYCLQPPCGQLNIINEKLYEVLGGVYNELIELFDTDVFHYGGDEVNNHCYNVSKEFREHFEKEGKQGTEDDILELWKVFQDRVFELVTEANGGRKMKGMIWTNRMTENEIETYLPKEDYIIHIWTLGKDKSIKDIVDQGYKTVFSNVDAWYFDCGYASWVAEGHNWCSPYKGWQVAYDNSPRKLYRNFTDPVPEFAENILGGVACMWAEQVEGHAIESKLWPRGASVGERLWSDPETSWKQAEYRMMNHRIRMVQRGIAADALQPEWCHQNEALCYLRPPKSNDQVEEEDED